jgi:hypothetical protein
MQTVWSAKERENLAIKLSRRTVEMLSEKDMEAKKNENFLKRIWRFFTVPPTFEFKFESEEVFPKVREEILDETVKDFCKEVSSKAEALWGAEAAGEVKIQEDDIKLKLREYFLEQMPPPVSMALCNGAISPHRRALAALTGTVFGMALGSLVFGLVVGERKTGILLGGLAFVWLTVRYVDSDTFATWVDRVCIFVGGWALWDFLSKNFRKMIPFAGKKSESKTTGKKMMAQVAPIIMKFLIKKEFDAESCEKTLRHIYESWLAAVDIMSMIFYEAEIARLLSSPGTEQERKEERNEMEEELKQELESARKDRKKTVEFMTALLRADVSTDQKRQDLIAELKSSAEVMGYSSPAEEFRIWGEEMLERFETFGVVRLGDDVDIVEQPVMAGSSVIKKGMVRKRRISK